MWCPVHNAGGETTVHAAMREMVNRGHEVNVICRPHSEERRFDNYEFEGVKVVRPLENNQHQWFKDYAENFNPDLLLTHLDLTFNAMQLALDAHRPLAHFIHNSMQMKFHRVNEIKCQLAVFNSQWVADAEEWIGPQIVIHPVVEPDHYRCERGEKITFVNPTPNKGADTFYSLSKVLPNLSFLTVKSVYGEQIAVPNINPNLHPNVETMEHVADAREYLRKTKIVLMPSDYESYGRVTVEAACCGIPAIVHPTEGLLEALEAETPDWLLEFTRSRARDYELKRRTETPQGLKGGWVSGAGIFCDRDDIDSWKVQIERLMTDEVYYRSRSDAALRLAEALDPQSEFDRLETALIETVENWRKKEEVKIVAMWISDKRYWETTDGSWVAERDGRIPQDATRLAVGIGGQVPEQIAIAKGLVEAKAISSPDENKAISAPQENKARRKAKVA